MKHSTPFVVGLLGAVLGACATLVMAGPIQDAVIRNNRNERNQRILSASAGNDRYGDYIISTGSVQTQRGAPTDGVWVLDYRTGLLLATVIDRNQGKITGWYEVDLVKEFNIPPKQDVHFMMTTGQVALGQSALYIAEVTTGKFGVYTMAPTPDGRGLAVIRHDMTTFRANQNNQQIKPAPAPAPVDPPKD